MEGRVLVACLSVLLVVASAAPAGADSRSIDAGTDPNGATVRVIDGSEVGQPGGGGAPSNGCQRRYVAALAPIYRHPDASPWLPVAFLPPAPSPAHQPFDVYCGDSYLTTVWAIPADAAAAVGAEMARELLAHIDFPAVSIGVNPTEGITGLPSWFWLDGDVGAPITRSQSAFGITVDLEVRVGDVRWGFGDGATLPGGPGHHYPTPSDIAHTYERRGAYTVTAGLGYHTRYRVDGGAWTDLDAVGRSVGTGYAVREVRSVLTR
jgi:hypothetical protein